jgi:hypothetical protein
MAKTVRSRLLFLLSLVALATSMLLGGASAASADGTFSETTTWGYHRVSVQSRSDDVKLTVTASDRDCDGLGAGVDVELWELRDGVYKFVKRWRYKNTNGCNSTRMWYPVYDAAQLEGRRSGSLRLYAIGCNSWTCFQNSMGSTYFNIG